MADQNTVLKEVQALEAKLDLQLSKAKSAQTATVVIYVVLTAIILGYFTFMASVVKDLVKPDSLATMASGYVTENITAVRKQLESQAKETAPALVNEMIDTLIKDQIPSGRKELETFLVKETEKQLDATEGKLLEVFMKTFEEHAPELRLLVSELQSEEGRQAFEDDLVKIMNEAIDEQGIKVEIESYGQAIKNVEDLLRRLSDPNEEATLTDEEKTVRELVELVREMSSRSKIGDVSLQPKLDEKAAKAADPK